jgi:acyl-homoserine-lactone acylase
VRDATIDWSLPVDGSVADTEWGQERWQPEGERYALPSFTNPPCGFIQSANDPPWVATVPPMTSRDFPRYIFPVGWKELGARGARQRALLHRGTALSREDLEAVVMDVFVPQAYYGIRALRRAFEAHRVVLPALSESAERLDRYLADWDGRAVVDSIAMTIAFYLDRTLPGGIPDVVIEEAEDPIATGEMREPVEPGTGARYGWALEAVAETLMARYGTIEKRWGEVHVIARPDGDVGLPGGCSALRALLGTWHGWWDVDDVLDDDGVERCNFGSRVLRLTELTKQGASVWSLSLTGQGPAAEHPGCPHVRDQSMLYHMLTLKRLPLAHPEIVAEVDERIHASCNHAGHEGIVWAKES